MRFSFTAGNLRSISHSIVLGVLLTSILAAMTVLATPETVHAQDQDVKEQLPKEKRNPGTHLVTLLVRSIPLVFCVALPFVTFGVVLLMVAKRLTFRNICFVIGVVLIVGPIWGFFGNLVFQLGAFRQLGEMEGAPKAAELADWGSLALTSICVGLAMCPIGILTIVFAAFRLKDQQE